MNVSEANSNTSPSSEDMSGRNSSSLQAVSHEDISIETVVDNRNQTNVQKKITEPKRLRFLGKVKFTSILLLLKLIVVRIFLVLLCGYAMAFFICISSNYRTLALIIPVFLIPIDVIYICLSKDGRDFTWFSLSSFGFTIVFMSIFWLAGEYKYRLEDVKCKKNDILTNLLDECIGIEINMCEALSLFECVFLMVVIILRWATPHSLSVSKKSHSTLIVAFLASAADVVDFIEYASFEEIVSTIGIHWLYGVTAISVLQYCFTLTATKKIHSTKHDFLTLLIDYFFGTEAWSVILVLFIQDLPYLIVRILIIKSSGVLATPTLLFFSIKNIFVVVADFYRLYGFYHEFREEREKLNVNKQVILKSFFFH